MKFIGPKENVELIREIVESLGNYSQYSDYWRSRLKEPGCLTNKVC